MKKPNDWQSMSESELIRWIEKLNVWNCKQPIPHGAHMEHYEKEIAPLVARREKLVKEWLENFSKNA